MGTGGSGSPPAAPPPQHSSSPRFVLAQVKPAPACTSENSVSLLLGRSIRVGRATLALSRPTPHCTAGREGVALGRSSLALPSSNAARSARGAGTDLKRTESTSSAARGGASNPAQAHLPRCIRSPALEAAGDGDATLVVCPHRHLCPAAPPAVAVVHWRRHRGPGGQREAEGCGRDVAWSRGGREARRRVAKQCSAHPSRTRRRPHADGDGPLLPACPRRAAPSAHAPALPCR